MEYTDFLELPGAALQRIPDHAERALRRLRPRFQNKPRIEAIVRAVAAEIQELEDHAWQVRTRAMVLENAEGANLDRFGALLDLARAGLADAAYIARLAVRILVNRSHGRIEDLIAVAVAFENITPDNGRVHPWDNAGDTTIIFEVAHALSEPASDLLRVLRRTKAAGVTFHLHYTPSGPDDTFTWGSTHSDPATLATTFEGFGSAHSVSPMGGGFGGVKV